MGDEQAKLGKAVGVGGAIAIATALLASRKAAAAPGEAPKLDDAIAELLLAIAKEAECIDSQLTTLNQTMAAALGVTITGIPTLKNPREITAFRVLCPAIAIPVQLPDRAIPYGMHLVIKAMIANGGIIYVANSSPESVNVNSSYTLVGNEAIEYEIENSDQIWISASVAGEGVVCTVEQKPGGF